VSDHVLDGTVEVIGVIDMELLSVIRRWHHRDHIPIREIERRTGLSRNTIRKYLRSNAVEVKFKVPERPSRLDPFADKLSGWLRVEAGKSRKQRRTARQLYADLVALGYDGSYGRVAASVRHWRAGCEAAQRTTGRGVFVPLAFEPGEAFQFDWSEDWATVSGKRIKLQAAHTKLSHSRAFVIRAYPLQTHEMLFDALAEAFRVLGGVPRRGIFDNMRTAVDRVGVGKARQVNARFAAMASHYLFEATFCNPASGWEKGQVEKNVQDARRQIWQAMPNFEDLTSLNAWLEVRCIERWSELQHGLLPGSVAEVQAQERASLMPMGRAFDGFVEHTKRVSPTCLVHFENNRYSVPASFANRPISLRVYPDRLVVAAEGQVLCEHARIIERSHGVAGRTVYDWRHYLAVIQRKPGALRNGAPFADMPEAFRRLQAQLLRHPGGDREMVDILALVLQHDEEAVLCAVELALEDGVATKTHILNVLHRLTDGKGTTAVIDAPQALVLGQEPRADIERYDALRDREARHAS
jgi:transposase